MWTILRVTILQNHKGCHIRIFQKWIRGYNLRSIEMFVESAALSAFAANLFAPLIVLYVISGFFSLREMSLWFLLHILVLILRATYKVKIERSLQGAFSDSLYKKIDVLFFLTSFTAFLYAYVVIVGALYEIPVENFFMLCAILLALSAGSISTLMSIFHFFVIFVFVTMFSSIFSLVYYQESVAYMFALLLAFFTVIFLKAGYKQYLLINNLITLKESFQTIYEKSSDGIVIFKKITYKDCNLAILKMFMYDSKEEFLQTNVAKIMPKYQPDGENSIKKMLKMAQLARKLGHISFEWQYKRKNGSLFWSEVVLTKVTIEGEALIHGVYRDISEKKELELQKDRFNEELQEQVKEALEKNRQKDQAMLQQSKLAQMGEMISMIAHQWRQPLSAISATSASLSLKAQLGTLESQTTKNAADNISQYAQHLSSTIDDFRNFFKENKTAEKTTLKTMLDGTLEIIKISLDNQKIEVEIIQKEEREIRTYINEVKQVILNIIKNAEDILIEKEIQNPKITITIEDATLTIADNAGGIPKEIEDKIFEPYFSTKTKKDGTGLGLYMSKTIIEDHCGGRLSVKNDAQGAVFCIDLNESRV